ncbi:MAG: hypothetical protein KDB14_14270 [Planctomycetales bacterium]|nr:hypothetical protein [Planctomycetales bacterium]
MDTAEAWRSLFENWPETIARDGSVVTATGDQIPFCGFLISGGLLLVERSRPDPSGNRKVMLTYDAISAVNLTSNAEMSKFQCMGFQPPL